METWFVPRCFEDINQRSGLMFAALFGEVRGRLIGSGMPENQAGSWLDRSLDDAWENAISMATEAWHENRSPCSADQLIMSFAEELCKALGRQCGEYMSHSSPNSILYCDQ